MIVKTDRSLGDLIWYFASDNGIIKIYNKQIIQISIVINDNFTAYKYLTDSHEVINCFSTKQELVESITDNGII